MGSVKRTSSLRQHKQLILVGENTLILICINEDIVMNISFHF